jgi:hypothetical protein
MKKDESTIENPWEKYPHPKVKCRKYVGSHDFDWFFVWFYTRERDKYSQKSVFVSERAVKIVNREGGLVGDLGPNMWFKNGEIT